MKQETLTQALAIISESILTNIESRNQLTAAINAQTAVMKENRSLLTGRGAELGGGDATAQDGAVVAEEAGSSDSQESHAPDIPAALKAIKTPDEFADFILTFGSMLAEGGDEQARDMLSTLMQELMAHLDIQSLPALNQYLLPSLTTAILKDFDKNDSGFTHLTETINQHAPKT